MRSRGFTLIELLVSLVLLVGLIAITVTSFPMGDLTAKKSAARMLGMFSDCEAAISNYLADKGESPTDSDVDNDFLDESELVPPYLFPQVSPVDSGWYTNGYRLDYDAGHGGWYVCARLPGTTSSNDLGKTIERLNAEIAPTRRGSSSVGCAEVTDGSPDGTPTTYYYTYWITRTS